MGSSLAPLRLLWHTQNMPSITVPQKKRGRPATGHSPRIGVRFDETLKARVEAYADKEDVTASEAIRRLVEKGLKAE